MPIELDMSIEETIEHLDQIAKNQFECADRIDELNCDGTSTRNMASYHKRLAEWLRELKKLRSDQKEVYFNGYTEGYDDGYCKALEDSH